MKIKSIHDALAKSLATEFHAFCKHHPSGVILPGPGDWYSWEWSDRVILIGFHDGVFMMAKAVIKKFEAQVPGEPPVYDNLIFYDTVFRCELANPKLIDFVRRLLNKKILWVVMEAKE